MCCRSTAWRLWQCALRWWGWHGPGDHKLVLIRLNYTRSARIYCRCQRHRDKLVIRETRQNLKDDSPIIGGNLSLAWVGSTGVSCHLNERRQVCDIVGRNFLKTHQNITGLRPYIFSHRYGRQIPVAFITIFRCKYLGSKFPDIAFVYRANRRRFPSYDLINTPVLLNSAGETGYHMIRFHGSNQKFRWLREGIVIGIVHIVPTGAHVNIMLIRVVTCAPFKQHIEFHKYSLIRRAGIKGLVALNTKLPDVTREHIAPSIC
ncbi:hypothetical protein ES703_07476 [subsurface metagenome]